MLTAIHLKNFKCFKDLSLPLAPLTLLTGFNAAGKSSVLQSLLLLVQSLRLDHQATTLQLNGPLVRLGTPGEVLNDDPDSKDLCIGVESDKTKIKWNLKADAKSEDQGHGNFLTITDIEHGTRKTVVERALSALMPEGHGAGDDAELIQTMKKVVFIGPSRLGTLDVFPSPDESSPVSANVGVQGEYAPWLFQKYSDDDVVASRRYSKAKDEVPLRRQYNAWGSYIFPGTEGNAMRVGTTGLVQLELKVSETSEWRRPSNIGYGITYAFPILVAGLLAANGQVLIIDSPEAHLHPQGQSRMGYFLAHMANAGVQIIVETHSDHFLNGVRLAIHEQSISPESVAVHFFKPAINIADENSARIVSPSIDKHGNLSDWPEGFFDQSEKDMERLAGWMQ